MPETKDGGWILDDSSVILKKNPYTKLPEKKKVEEEK